MDDWHSGGFGLYLHWPFCQSKCPYCDFNSHVAARIDQRRWRDAYLREIRRIGAETQGRVLQTVFFGGGTPTQLPAADLVFLLGKLRASFGLAAGADWAAAAAGAAGCAAGAAPEATAGADAAPAGAAAGLPPPGLDMSTTRTGVPSFCKRW